MKQVNYIIQHQSLTKNSESHNVKFAFEATLVQFSYLHLITMWISFMVPQSTQLESSPVASYSQVQKSLQVPEGVSVLDFEEKLYPFTARDGDVTCSFHLRGP